MEISSSLTLHLSPSSVRRPSPASLPFSASHSSFFVSTPSLRLSNRVRAVSVVSTRIRRLRFSVNALFGLGVPELVVIAGVAALLFGPKNLPEVGKSIGKTVKSFQQAAKEFESELKKDPDTLTEESDVKSISNEKKEDEVSSTKESV